MHAPTSIPQRTIIAALAGMLAFFATGCSTPPTARTFAVPADQYQIALDAVRDELRAAGYTVERVDANAGEILTAPKTVAGIATPLAPENRWPSGVVSDTLSNRPRTVRVRFRDAIEPASPPQEGRDVVAEVDAMIWRRLRPGWRLETETTIRNLYWIDPALGRRGVNGATVVPLKRDDVYATELTEKITARIGKQAG